MSSRRRAPPPALGTQASSGQSCRAPWPVCFGRRGSRVRAHQRGDAGGGALGARDRARWGERGPNERQTRRSPRSLNIVHAIKVEAGLTFVCRVFLFLLGRASSSFSKICSLQGAPLFLVIGGGGVFSPRQYPAQEGIGRSGSAEKRAADL